MILFFLLSSSSSSKNKNASSKRTSEIKFNTPPVPSKNLARGHHGFSALPPPSPPIFEDDESLSSEDENSSLLCNPTTSTNPSVLLNLKVNSSGTIDEFTTTSTASTAPISDDSSKVEESDEEEEEEEEQAADSSEEEEDEEEEEEQEGGSSSYENSSEYEDSDSSEYETDEESEYETDDDDDDDDESSDEKAEESHYDENEKKRPQSVIIPKLSGCPIKGMEPIKNKPRSSTQSAGTLPLATATTQQQKQKTKTSPTNKPIIPSLLNCPIKGDNKTTRESSEISYDDVNGGNLSKLEQTVNKEDPKWQLIFEKMKSDETDHNQTDAINTDYEEVQFLYTQERHNRKIYNTQRIHISILKLLFSLMLTPSGTLEPLYSDQFPLDNKKHNIPFLLREHLSHNANQNIIPQLVDESLEMGRCYFRLLKLLCTKLFRKDMYSDLHRLAIGAYGTVYSCTVKPQCQSMNVAIKLMEVPKSIHDRCVLHDIFDEILILDKFKFDSRISRTFDFGTDDEYFWITMKKYKCSLKNWRQKQKAPLKKNLSLYLNIYMNVLNTFQFLKENSVNHFDIKCDNFLIQPLNDDLWTDDDENHFWDPISDVPNFSVCLADFGEAKFFSNEIEAYTTRNRGTEFNKSPEMLAVAYASQKTRSTYDRRKKVGASSPSDIWSLGCLLYELLTGEFLFYEQDCARFFIRVTSPGQELLTPEKMAKIDNNHLLREFLLFILTRDPRMRPSIADVIQRFKYVRALLSESYLNSDDSFSPRIPTPRDSIINSPELNRKKSSSSSSSSSTSTSSSTSSIHEKKSSNRNSNSSSNLFKLITSQSEKKYNLLSPPNHDDEDNDNTHKNNENKKEDQSSEGTNNEDKDKNNHSDTISNDDDSKEEKTNINFPLIHSISQDKLSIAEYNAVQIPDYFLKTCSEIFENIYISPLEVATQRDHLKYLGISHLINCTNDPNLYSVEFMTLHIPLTKPQILIDSLDKIVHFINDAMSKNGKVLIYSHSGRSSSAIVVIGYLMITRNWSYFESFIFIRNQRYIIDPDEKFVTALCTFFKSEKLLCHFQKYQCLCGACAFTVTKAFQHDPISCSCSFDNPSPNCPNVGCSDFLISMRKCFKYPANEVMWGFTSINFLEGDFGKTSLYVPNYDRKSLASLEEYKNWIVYKCSSCDFITHAIKKKNIIISPDSDASSKLSSINHHFDAAVVTSIPVDHTKQVC